ncbi:MAG: biotin transporter BioY [Phycisphaerae bacterium]
MQNPDIHRMLYANHVAPRAAVVGWSGARLTARILGFAIAAALSAQFRVFLPATDVPFTLQTVVVLLAGFMLPPLEAGGAMLLYVACGAVGLPVFATSAGLSGLTAGYLLAFPVAAWAISLMRGRREAGVVRLLVAGCAGTLIVFGMAALWRALLVRGFGGSPATIASAVAVGVWPFVATAGVKLVLAASIVLSLRRVSTVRKRGHRSTSMRR